MSLRSFVGVVAGVLLGTALVTAAHAGTTDQLPSTPHDFSFAGLAAYRSLQADPSETDWMIPEEVTAAARDYVTQMKVQGLTSRTGRFSVLAAPGNVRANNPAGDAVGETQSEVAIAVYGDTVVVGWNDSRGFTAGFTLTSFAYSTDGGATFTDGGNVPLALPTDQAFGDAGLDTDERGNWYLNQIYTRTAGNPGATAQQNIGVHHGRFNNLGQLVWDAPTMASIGAGATGTPAGNLDKCLLACDRVTGNVYVAYLRLSVTPSRIEVVRSTTLGATWDAPVVLDNTTTPTTSKQGARPFCGPNGEVYVVWEKGANIINCPDGAGNVTNSFGQIAFTRSLDFGVTYSPFSVIGTPGLTFMASGPGDNRERGNEFPDIAVDRSGGPWNGNIYVTWHEAPDWLSNLSGGTPYTEVQDATNGSPATPEAVSVGMNVSGTIVASGTGNTDYYSFTAVQGQSYFFNLDPQGFNCGVSGTTVGMRMRLYANSYPAGMPPTSTFADSMLAASSQGAFAQRIVWTAPKSGTYLLRVNRTTSSTTATSYLLRLRTLSFSGGFAARDVRDVVEVQSADGGLTWSSPRRINDDPAGLENRRPFIAADGRGHVHAFWHDSRNPGLGTNATLTHIYGTTSRDGGATWSPNFQTSDEVSFFSFNTRAVPNLGDYNQAAGNAGGVYAAWSDQRLSTGDVFDPLSLVYTAGLGPEAYTTHVVYAHTVQCEGPVLAIGGGLTMATYRVTNTGTVPDAYAWNASDVNGWLAGALSGTTPTLQPGQYSDVQVLINPPGDCAPSLSDVVTFAARPTLDALAVRSCQTPVTCDNATPTLLAGFWAERVAEGVELRWVSKSAAGVVRSWIVERSNRADGEFTRLTASPIAMGADGEFRFVDAQPLAGTAVYRLSGEFTDGHLEPLQTLEFSAGGVARSLELRFAGENPFRGRTTLVYALPNRGPVRIDVFSVTGQRVRTLVEGVREPGVYTESFSLRDGDTALPPGLYMIRMNAAGRLRSLRAVALE
jgi:hypothetical protein